MKERNWDIETTDERMDTFITHPDQDGPFPAVIIHMVQIGLRLIQISHGSGRMPTTPRDSVLWENNARSLPVARFL